MNWLFKEEPTHYSFDDFTKDKKTMWSGVRNPVAQKHLHAVKKGDRVFFYHTGDEKAVVGIAKALGEDRKSTRLNSSHTVSSYAVFCLKKKNHGRSRGQSLRGTCRR